MNFRHHLHGERAGCMKTDILREYPLDEPGDVNFVFESTMWYRIDRDYKTICVNDSLKYYTENGSDSISVGIQRDLNAKYCTSQFYCYAFYINQIFDYMLLDKKFLIRIIINITRRGIEAGRSITEIYNSIDDVRKRFLVILASPIGIVLSNMDKKKYKIEKNKHN